MEDYSDLILENDVETIGTHNHFSTLFLNCKTIVLDVGCKKARLVLTVDRDLIENNTFNLDLIDSIIVNGMKFIRKRDDE